LAIQLSPEHLAPRSQVDATETHIRIRGLLEAGHSVDELAHALGRTSASLRRTLDRGTVTAQTAASIGELYDRLQRKALNEIPAATVPAGNIVNDHA
jgi:hypothetical protein